MLSVVDEASIRKQLVVLERVADLVSMVAVGLASFGPIGQWPMRLVARLGCRNVHNPL